MEQVLTISENSEHLESLKMVKMRMCPFLTGSLWGPYNLRGWDYREAGPLFERTDEPEGGNSLSYATLEYTFKLADPLRFALFYDGGFLRRKDFKFTPETGMKIGMITGA